MKPGDLTYENHNFNRYRTVISFISNFLTEVTDTDDMFEMLNEFSNEINELKSDYFAGKNEEIDDIIENTSLVYNNQLRFFDDYILKYKQKTPAKQISKPGSSSSPWSMRVLSQKTIAERVNLKSQERKKSGTGLKILTPNKLLNRLQILLAQTKAENNS